MNVEVIGEEGFLEAIEAKCRFHLEKTPNHCGKGPCRSGQAIVSHPQVERNRNTGFRLPVFQVF